MIYIRMKTLVVFVTPPPWQRVHYNLSTHLQTHSSHYRQLQSLQGSWHCNVVSGNSRLLCFQNAANHFLGFAG